MENVTFGEDHGAIVDLEGVVGNIVEVVVDSVEQGVTENLGGTAGDVVEVVALKSDELLKLAFLPYSCM